MFRTVAVQQGLTEIMEKLKQEGYEVVDITDTRADIMAMVYSSSIDPEEYQYSEEISRGLSSSTGSMDGFVLMLNAAEMPGDEVVSRIKALG